MDELISAVHESSNIYFQFIYVHASLSVRSFRHSRLVPKTPSSGEIFLFLKNTEGKKEKICKEVRI